MIRQNKSVIVAEPNLYSGSADSIRTALGLGIDSEAKNNAIVKVEVDSSDIRDGLQATITAKYRLIGDTNVINNDKQWKAIVYGGTFAEQTYEGFFTEESFTDHYHTELNPYSRIETKRLNIADTSSPNVVAAAPMMNHYYSRYEEYAQGLPSILNIPNAYTLMQTYSSEDDIKQQLNMDLPLGDLSFNQTASLQENIFVTRPEIYEDIVELNNASHLLPHYVSFDFNFETQGAFVAQCVERGFSNRFIKVLKDTFLGEDGAPTPAQVTFTLTSTELGENNEVSEVESTANLDVVDLIQMMDYSLRDYNTETSNFEYLLDNSEDAKSQYENNSIQRFDKTIPTIRQTNWIADYLDTWINSFGDEPLSPTERYNEVVAYRLEKIGGRGTGDANTQNTLQNFWFLNTIDVDDFEYIDNQVLYGEEYTYNIYKYVLIAGAGYSYSDLRITQTINDLGAGNWCLEFYNPETNEAIAPLYDNSNVLTGSLNTGAQINSSNKYLADFQVDIVPSIKIVEIPILSKTLSVLDSPTNPVNVIPFYERNDSNRIGFNVRYDAPIETPFPTTLTTAEDSYRDRYLESYDLLSDETFLTDSVSLPITLEIYRLDSKPTSLADFSGNLLATKSMKIENEDAVTPVTTIYDKIPANRKYYYLFRIANEVESPAYASHVIEASLQADGGYKFGLFESYFENELAEETLTRERESFKKLINLVPSINNFFVNDSDADYTNLASNEVDNITFGEGDVVWDRTFKLRLTSKKTGKKIDINVTYKVDG
jgi:hypothetical protein